MNSMTEDELDNLILSGKIEEIKPDSKIKESRSKCIAIDKISKMPGFREEHLPNGVVQYRFTSGYDHL